MTTLSLIQHVMVRSVFRTTINGFNQIDASSCFVWRVKIRLQQSPLVVNFPLLETKVLKGRI